jgi:hypothetical protein
MSSDLRGFLNGPQKNDVLCPQRAFLPIQSGYNSPLKIKMIVQRTFLEIELAGAGVAACSKL